MKKLLTALAAAAALTSAAAHAGEISVAATAVPHAELLEFVKPALAKEGVELKIKVFTDYVQPNVQVAEGRLDANFFQHQPYLDEFNASRGTALVSIAGVHVDVDAVQDLGSAAAGPQAPHPDQRFSIQSR